MADLEILKGSWSSCKLKTKKGSQPVVQHCDSIFKPKVQTFACKKVLAGVDFVTFCYPRDHLLIK